MELLCCIAFLVGLVSGSPYGYTKGGAIAKADAGAASGTFGGSTPLPFSIPSGSEYSGSFAKSSSSSFASSSAISSSSSSSYSFSGTKGGLNTFKTNNNGVLGGAGCTSGGCHSSGGQGIIGSTDLARSGASLQGYTGNSVAIAIAKSGGSEATGTALNGGNIENQVPCSDNGCVNQATRCEGGSCKDIEVHKCSSGKCDLNIKVPSNIKCASGNCEPDFPNVPLSGHNTNIGCVTDDCYPNSNSGTIVENYSTNSDINSSYDAKQQYKTNEQPSMSFNGSDNECPQEKCGLPIKTPTNEISSPGLNQNIPQPSKNSNCGSSHCDSGKFEVKPDNKEFGSGSQKLTTDLSSPSLEAGCTTGNCNTGYAVTERENPPSSNDLYDSSSMSGIADCTSGKCGGDLSNQVLPSPHVENIYPKVNPIGCTTANCASSGSYSANNLNLQAQHIENGEFHPFNNFPSFASSGLRQQTHPTTYASCTTPNCSPQPSSNPPEYSNTYNIYPSTGCNTPNCASGLPTSGIYENNQPQLVKIPSLSPNKESSYTSHGLAHAPLGITTGCNTPNCAYKPALSPSASFAGNQLSCNLPHCSSTAGDTQILAPNPILIESNLHNTPIDVHPNDCKTTNCAENRPNEKTLKENIPPYTGGFGGPSGILKPNELSPSSIMLPGTTPSPLNQSNKNLPTYSGGFGGPTGILQPIESVYVPDTVVNTQSQNPGYSGGFGVPVVNTPLTVISDSGGFNLTSGSTNTKTNPLYDNKYLSHTGGFGRPKDTSGQDSQTVSHLGSYLSSVDTSKYTESSNNQFTGHFGVNTPTQIGINPIGPKDQKDKNTISYTGGFNVPAGVSKPNDYSSSENLNKFTAGSSNEPCLIGNCGSTLDSNINFPKDSGVSKESQSAVLAVSKADAVAYVGGFGGPPGLLKPFDEGKLGAHMLIKGKLSKDSLGEGTVVQQEQQSDVSQASLGLTRGKLGTHIRGINQQNEGSHFLTSSQSDAAAASQASAIAQASATAGSFSSGYGIHSGYQAGSGSNIKEGGGCGGGCGGMPASDLPGSGYSGFNTVGAESLADARSFGGFGSSYSSSSASARASSGYATKGGYGKR